MNYIKKGKEANTGATAAKNTDLQLPGWAPIAALVFTALIYTRALSNGITNLDDDFYLVLNPYLRNFSFAGIKDIFTSYYTANYHPLTTLTYFIEYHFFELNPYPYHFTNVALHIANTWLAYKLAKQLSGKDLTALVVAILFGIHPMHVESVAWISERKDVMYTFFYLLAAITYLRYLDSSLNRRYLLLSSLFFLCSLLSKAAAVTLPVLLIAFDVYRGRQVSARVVVEKIPLLVLSVIFGIVNIMAQKAGGSLNDLLISYGFINGIFLFTSGVSFYIIWCIAPVSLCAMHYFPEVASGMLPWQYYISLPFLIGVIWLLFRRHNLRKEVLFGSAFFIITISVMLQIVSVGSALTAERYTYVAYIGLFYIVGQLVSYVQQQQSGPIVMAGVGLVCVVFAVQTYDRIGVWKDGRVLFTDVIEKNPTVYIGYWMRGNLSRKEGDLKMAMQDYSKAITYNPKFEDAYFNRGLVYDVLGNPTMAIADYNRALSLNNKMADAYNNRGWAKFELGDKNGAIGDLDSAIILKPEYAEAYNNRGWVRLNMRDTAAALTNYGKAIAADKQFVKPYFNRAALRTMLGDLKNANEDYSAVLNLYPDDEGALYYRGMNNYTLNEKSAACKDWIKAAQGGSARAAAMVKERCR